MQQYKDFSPTIFDRKGAFIHDERSGWFIVPVSRTRDTGYFEESNFETALELLGGEGDKVEVHRFGHWGPGWFEIIIVNPNSPQYAIALDIEERLQNYPILDEDDFCQREWNEYMKSWDQYAAHEFRRALHSEFELDYKPYTDNILDSISNESLLSFWEELHSSGEYFIPDSGGLYFDIDRTRKEITVPQFAKFIRDNRRAIASQ